MNDPSWLISINLLLNIGQFALLAMILFVLLNKRNDKD